MFVPKTIIAQKFILDIKRTNTNILELNIQISSKTSDPQKHCYNHRFDDYQNEGKLLCETKLHFSHLNELKASLEACRPPPASYVYLIKKGAWLS